MKNYILPTAIFCIILIAQPSFGQATSKKSKPESSRSFVVIDAMKSRKAEPLSKYGLKNLTLIYTAPMWPGAKTRQERADVPKKEIIEALSVSNKPDDLPLITFDIEHWPLDIRKTVFKDSDDIMSDDTARVQNNIGKMVQILKWAKEANPEAMFGYYGCVPVRDYFTPVRGDAAKIKKWQEANNVLQPLADECDVLFPSIYTFYNDQESWVRYAKGNIAEAKRLAKGKPIYVYVWPRYHTSNKELAYQYIDGEFWRLQLETIYAEGVQGIAIWDGSKLTWEPEAEWWKATLDFMKSKGLVMP